MSTRGRIVFDTLSDGVLIVSRRGELRYANAAAQALQAWQAGSRLEAGALLDVVDAIASGRVTPPHRIVCTVADRRGVPVTLYEAAQGGDLFIVLGAAPVAATPDLRLANFMRLLHAELGPELERVTADSRQAATLGRRLTRLGKLAQAHLEGPLVDKERLTLTELALHALGAVSAQAKRRGIRIVTRGFTDLLPTVYGSRKWLTLALGEYLEHAIRDARRDTVMEMRAMQYGAFVTIAVRNRGHGILAHVRDALSRGQPAAPAGGGAVAPLPRIGLSICSRVLELHGGHVRIESDEETFTDFIFELPTGGPAQEEAAQGIMQAQRYAQDLAQLMARRRGSTRAAAATIQLESSP